VERAREEFLKRKQPKAGNGGKLDIEINLPAQLFQMLDILSWYYGVGEGKSAQFWADGLEVRQGESVWFWQRKADNTSLLNQS
jgi:hypothetical protein